MNDRFKFRIWWKKENRYRVDTHIIPIGHLTDFANSDQYVVEQCTGLKDKNGNLIYEGDIVKCDRDFDPDGRVNLTKEVIFTDGTFTLANLDPKNRDFCYINRFHNIEIIGNIHEQPEQKDK